MKIGILGGTFDPIHLGHLILGEVAREQLSLERVLFIPAGRQWRKEEKGDEITPAAHRLEMVRLAIEGNDVFETSTMEIERDGPTYTADTLAKLSAEPPDDELFLIVGADALADMPHWHLVERIFELATVCAAARPGETPTEGPFADRVRWIEMPEIEISSTTVRRRVRDGRSIRYLVPAAVAEYIRENRLYMA